MPEKARWRDPGMAVGLSGSIVEHLNLLTHRFAVNCLKHFLHEIGTHAHFHSQRYAVVKDVVGAGRLHYRHAVLLFVLADFARHTHTLVEHLEQFVVELVDLLAQ